MSVDFKKALEQRRQKQMSDSNKPEKQFRSGALSVGVWRRRNNDQVFFNAMPQRSYLDEKDTTSGPDGTWKYTDSLGYDDLPVMAALLNQAFSYIVAEKAKLVKV